MFPLDISGSAAYWVKRVDSRCSESPCETYGRALSDFQRQNTPLPPPPPKLSLARRNKSSPSSNKRYSKSNYIALLTSQTIHPPFPLTTKKTHHLHPAPSKPGSTLPHNPPAHINPTINRRTREPIRRREQHPLPVLDEDHHAVPRRLGDAPGHQARARDRVLARDAEVQVQPEGLAVGGEGVGEGETFCGVRAGVLGGLGWGGGGGGEEGKKEGGREGRGFAHGLGSGSHRAGRRLSSTGIWRWRGRWGWSSTVVLAFVILWLWCWKNG